MARIPDAFIDDVLARTDIVELIGARVPRNAVTTALYWDTGDPYHYIRVQPLDGDYDLLIKVYVDEEQDIGKFINDNIATVPGINRSLTTLTFNAF